MLDMDAEPTLPSAPSGAREPLVLVVDDDVPLAEEVASVFGRYGFTAAVAANWHEALRTVRDRNPDVILLDQHLGGVDAVARIPHLRMETSAPILVVTASRELADRIIGLEIGADDFITKPVAGRELVARVRVALRRNTPPPATTETRGWQLDRDSSTLRNPEGAVIPLSRNEGKLLWELFKADGRPVSRQELSRSALGREWQAGDRAVESLICILRQKLDSTLSSGPIRTIRGIGYAFVGPP